jgi:hypothetical protein
METHMLLNMVDSIQMNNHFKVRYFLSVDEDSLHAQKEAIPVTGRRDP